MNDKSAVLAQIELRWREDGLSINGPASAEDIDRFCRRYSVALPPALVAYVRHLNGMAEPAHDRDLFRFWPLSEIQTVAEWSPYYKNLAAYQGVFLVADWSIDAHGYGIRLDGVNTGAVVLVGAQEPIPVVESFWSFLEMYLEDPDSLFPKK